MWFKGPKHFCMKQNLTVERWRFRIILRLSKYCWGINAYFVQHVVWAAVMHICQVFGRDDGIGAFVCHSELWRDRDENKTRRHMSKAGVNQFVWFVLNRTIWRGEREDIHMLVLKKSEVGERENAQKTNLFFTFVWIFKKWPLKMRVPLGWSVHCGRSNRCTLWKSTLLGRAIIATDHHQFRDDLQAGWWQLHSLCRQDDWCMWWYSIREGTHKVHKPSYCWKCMVATALIQVLWARKMHRVLLSFHIFCTNLMFL